MNEIYKRIERVYEEQFKSNASENEAEFDKIDYIGYSSLTIINVFLSVVFSEDVDKDERMTWTTPFKNSLGRLRKGDYRRLIKYLAMDYFAFLANQNEVDEFNKTEVKDEFLKRFKFNKKERRIFEENLKSYHTGFNSHLLLKTMNFPKRYDDYYLLNLLDNFKEAQFIIMRNRMKKDPAAK